jgi:hypothetical protein
MAASIITTTIHDTITKTVSAAASPSPSLRATPQGGILEHGNPTVYDPKNPIILFIIQVRSRSAISNCLPQQART